jgi:putative FmdB family regulatory protein
MPIYAYRCSTCGHAKDVLQKMSDPVLTTCPECGAATFVKQVTAAGFQLKGSGWYVTDFRGDNKPAPKPDGAKTDTAAAGTTAKTEVSKAESSSSEPSAAKSEAAPAPAAPASTPPASGTK